MWSFTLHLGGVSSEAPEEKEGELVTGTQGLPMLTHTHLSARVLPFKLPTYLNFENHLINHNHEECTQLNISLLM